MLDILDLLDYIQDDCVFDIYDCDSKDYDCVAKGLEREQLEEWANNHSYRVYSLEPIQRKGEQGDTIFGIVFNLGEIEESED